MRAVPTKRLGQVATGWVFAIVGLVACSDHGYVSSTSIGAIPAELASSRQEQGDHVFDYLLRHNVIGTPTDYAGTTIDWPVDKPQSELSDTGLEEAVWDSGGRVFVGFKHPEAARLSETATETNGRRVASIAPVARTIIEQGRAAIKAEGGRIIRPYRHLPFVVAIVDPEAATVLRRNPLVSWVEPVVRFKLGNATVPDNLSQIRAPDAWPVTEGDGARVWILDSGTAGGYQGHADLPPLSPNTCLSFTSWYPDCESPNDFPKYGHGTEVDNRTAGVYTTITKLIVATRDPQIQGTAL